jgi:hypothetical protein
MQRWLTILLGAAVVVLAAALVLKGFTPPKALPHAPEDAAADAASEASASANAGLGELPGDGGLFLPDLAIDTRMDAGTFGKMPDGTPVPAMSANAPKTVRIGVVLISYAGAQSGPLGEKPNPRSKADAKALAEKLAGEAAADFHGAVQRGDPGSQDDIGKIKMGFLEPSVDFVVFSLAVGAVSPAFDTPRGYWIAKRIE